MSRVLTLELSEEAYKALQQQAEIADVSISDWITTSLEQLYGLQKKQQTEA
ncbi:hypothetical protein [Scytonema sp. PRP1]|uniref:hypothetical protein n=1 Tax=Scytonema sp. PRP1 TaxID=3120513 RepID=UPI002FD3CF4C